MPTPSEQNGQPENVAIKIVTDKAQTTYVNFCRSAMTPNEAVLDFGFTPNSPGAAIDESLSVTNRLILSPVMAKQLLFQLNELVRRHEQNFGEVEIDFRRRLKMQPLAETPVQ